MTDRKRQGAEGKTPWPASGDGREARLDPDFPQKVTAAIRRQVVYRDFLFLILLGFWNILLGFLKPGRRPARSEPEGE